MKRFIAPLFAAALVVAPMSAFADVENNNVVELPLYKGVSYGNEDCLTGGDCVILREVTCVHEALPGDVDVARLVANNPGFPPDLQLTDCFPADTIFKI